ncbi:hypothetical protein [Flyfo siphovirus Tbat2_3]|nr:hypothetical protein [Flyfo siphovirus Tbat2_3]
MDENKFRCTGLWNGEKFDRVIEGVDEADCHLHWMLWALIAGANLKNLQVNRVAN